MRIAGLGATDLGHGFGTAVGKQWLGDRGRGTIAAGQQFEDSGSRGYGFGTWSWDSGRGTTVWSSGFGTRVVGQRPGAIVIGQRSGTEAWHARPIPPEPGDRGRGTVFGGLRSRGYGPGTEAVEAAVQGRGCEDRAGGQAGSGGREAPGVSRSETFELNRARD